MKTKESKQASALVLLTEQERLDKRSADIDRELATMFGGKVSKPAGKKRGPKSKTQPKTKAKSKTRGRAKSPDGRSIIDVLVQSILPTTDYEPFSLDDVMGELKARKINSTDASVRQSMIKLVKDNIATRPDRGLYILTAKGAKIQADFSKPAKSKKKASAKKADADPAVPVEDPAPAAA